MSGGKVKQNKGRSKALPKLKTILANPIKSKCPTLNDDEMQELRYLLQSAIKESGVQEARVFASNSHIRLGLESCLRAINNRQCGCIVLSLNIKPWHLVGLIARNAEVKDATVPVYAQPQLEKFTEEVFGVRALALVLPKESQILGTALEKWTQTRKRPKRIREETTKKRYKNIKNIVKVASMEDCKATGKVIAAPENMGSTRSNDLSGDFISFSINADNMQLNKLKLEEDKTNLLNALAQISHKVKIEQPIMENTKMKTETEDKMDIVEGGTTGAPGVDSEADEFLSVYKSLTVHKIRGNSDKKPKKKRKKNNKEKC